MPELTDFLLARIAEDEAVARQPYLHSLSGITATDPATLIGQLDDWQKRVLAECETKRRILALDWDFDEGRLGALRQVELLLALPYADHPDYDETWRP